MKLIEKLFEIKISVSYRAVISVCFVSFAFLSSAITAAYLFIGITQNASESAQREVSVLAKNIAQTLSHKIELEVSRAWNLARDSDVLLATRSVLFIDDAALRIQEYQNTSALSSGVFLLSNDGKIIIDFPSRQSTFQNFSVLFEGVHRVDLLTPQSEVDLLFRQEIRIAKSIPQKNEVLLIAAPVHQFTGLAGFVIVTISKQQLMNTVAQMIPNSMMHADLFFALRSKIDQHKALEQFSAESDVQMQTDHISSDIITVFISESKEETLKPIKEKLKSSVLLILLLCIALAIGAYFVSLLFVLPFRSLSKLIENFSDESSNEQPKILRFREFETVSETLTTQRHVITSQIEMLGATISQLEISNSRLTWLASEVRKLATCTSLHLFETSLQSALEILKPECCAVFIRSASDSSISEVYRSQALPRTKISSAHFNTLVHLSEFQKQTQEETVSHHLPHHPPHHSPHRLPEEFAEFANFFWRIYRDKDSRAVMMSGSRVLQNNSPDIDPSLDTLLNAARVALDNIQLLEKIRQEERARASLENAKIEAELMTLKNQMNPHFLFNSLNSIAHLVEEDPDRSIVSLSKLSDLYRKIMGASVTLTTRIEIELEIVQLYLELESIRFTDRLRYQIDLELENREVYIPSLMLQTLVENAVKHGVSKSVQGGEIIIKICALEKNILVSVTNSGAEFTQSSYEKSEAREEGGGTDVGIANTKRRLNLLYGESGQLHIQKDSKGRTQVKITFSGDKL